MCTEGLQCIERCIFKRKLTHSIM